MCGHQVRQAKRAWRAHYRPTYTTEENYKMKRASYAMLCGLLLLSLSSLWQPVHAQDPAKAAMRSDIASVLSKFVTAINAGDTTTAASMISAKPNVSAIV